MQYSFIIKGGAYYFEEGTVVIDEYKSILNSLKVPLHVFVNMQYRIWELEQLNTQMFQENIRLRRKALGFEHVEIIGNSGGLRNTMEKVKQIAPLDIQLLIHGATGTDKELIAQAVNQLSARKAHPFVVVNCGAIPPSLIDSELFGYTKGAFTGAAHDHKGYF